MRFLLLLYTSFFGLIFANGNAQSEGKHLFILSGQSNMVLLKPNETFIPALEKEFGKENIIVVKDAMGSQSISRWYKNWEVLEGQSNKEIGDLYDRLILKVKDSIKNSKIATITFVWMQGERDARMKNASVYEQSLLGLYIQLCFEMQNFEINFVIGRLNDFDMQNLKWPHWTAIRDIQEKVANSNPLFTWVNTDDLNDGLNNEGKQVVNDIHMSMEGYKILGERFAASAIELIKLNQK